MWETLDPPWQAALEMAWEAYCNGTIPIGAAVADADGHASQPQFTGERGFGAVRAGGLSIDPPSAFTASGVRP